MRLKRDERPTRLEMIPLLDVVFLLLVFFIYAMLSMVVHRGLPVNLPKSATASDARKDHLSITVTREGAFIFEGRQVNQMALVKRLKKARSARPNITVFIFGDRRAPYDAVVKGLDSVRIAGIARVSLETEEKGD